MIYCFEHNKGPLFKAYNIITSKDITENKPLLTVNSPQRSQLYNGYSFALADSPNIHSYFNLAIMQSTLKSIPTAKITPRQMPVNQRLKNGI